MVAYQEQNHGSISYHAQHKATTHHSTMVTYQGKRKQQRQTWLTTFVWQQASNDVRSSRDQEHLSSRNQGAHPHSCDKQVSSWKHIRTDTTLDHSQKPRSTFRIVMIFIARIKIFVKPRSVAGPIRIVAVITLPLIRFTIQLEFGHLLSFAIEAPPNFQLAAFASSLVTDSVPVRPGLCRLSVF